jgi:pimeloyl-ACP methyl ester carboxylesterase
MVSAMVDVSETRYAKNGDAHIAYRVAGDGPIDLVLIADWFGHVEAAWEEPSLVRCFECLGSFARLLIFDKRGVGMSDPVPLAPPPPLDDWMDDVRVVMDAAGSRQAAVVGVGAGGPMAMLYAAAHPERVSALVLVNTYARLARADDYRFGFPEEARRRILEESYTDFNQFTDILSTPDPADPGFAERWARYLRQAASPGSAHAMREMMFEVDVRAVLPTIQAPTLVLHRRDDPWIRNLHGRHLADHIPEARYVELEGSEDLFFRGDTDALLGEIQEFLTGFRPVPESDRLLATILFTDIVGSTERAASVGDRRWRELLDQHDAVVRKQLDLYRGREIDTAGDSFLAIFDGPTRAVRGACAIRDAVRVLDLEIRAGLHSGEVEQRANGIGGIAVHIGARVEAHAGPNEVLTTSTVKDLVAGSGIAFADRGFHTLKGVPDEWQLFEVQG